MFVTKLGHSCVLVETEDRIGLFDPGLWTDKDLLDGLGHVDRIAYTHDHPDHFDENILRELIIKFPHANVVCNSAVSQKIIDAGIDCVIREETQCTRTFRSLHGRPANPALDAPLHTGYHFKQLFTHPGDSDTFTETMEVLAMPFVSRWGRCGDAIEKVIELKPKYVLPIHDWHYHDDGKKKLMQLLQDSLENSGIKLLAIENGVRHEIQ